MKNAKKYIKLSIILYIVILCVALVSTLAWFTFEKSATISTEDESKIVAGEYLEICIDDGNDNWATDIKVDNVAQFPDISVTPEGKAWYPISLDEGDKLFVGEKGKGVYSDVTDKEGYFVKLPLKVRASKAIDVYLHQDSFVEGIELKKTDADGKYSKDAISGASRVAFFDENGAKMMWVPNENYQLFVDEDTGEIIDFKFDGEKESEYKYLNVIDDTVTKDNEYGEWDPDEVQILEGKNSLATDTANNGAAPILSFNKAEEKKITLYIWIEGSDREANTIFSGGELSYNIKLTGITRKAESKINIEDVAYSAGKLIYTSSGAEVGDEILYSYNSETWTPYSSGNPDLAGENEVIYVRAKETATENAGPIKEITVK